MWLIKSEEETNPSYGKSPNERSIEELINTSIVVVDKHPGPTSHQITEWVRKIFQAKKAGNAGILDPKVSGVLIVALGNATKAMQVLLGLDKEYVGIMHLHKSVDEEILRKFISEKFVGKIEQVPPRRAAVARKKRKKEVYFFDILEVKDKDVLFRTCVEAGTYVRKLVSDLGKALNVGAHMTELRRIRAGNFTEEQSHSLIEIKDAYDLWKEKNDEKELRKILIPIEYAILHVKRVFVKDSAVDAICNGSPIYSSGIVRIQDGIKKGETIAIYTLKEELVALGIAKMESEKMFQAKKGVAIRNDRVFMPKGIYPSWKR